MQGWLAPMAALVNKTKLWVLIAVVAVRALVVKPVAVAQVPLVGTRTLWVRPEECLRQATQHAVQQLPQPVVPRLQLMTAHESCLLWQPAAQVQQLPFSHYPSSQELPAAGVRCSCRSRA